MIEQRFSRIEINNQIKINISNKHSYKHYKKKYILKPSDQNLLNDLLTKARCLELFRKSLNDEDDQIDSEKLSNAMMILMAVMQIWQMWMQMQAAKAKSSSLLGFAGGGYVSGAGTSTSDSIPARLSDGEYVVRAKAVRALGTDFLDRLNAAGSGLSGKGKLPKFRYAEGGYVTADTNADPANNSGAVGGQPIQLVMNNNFQSVDPKANMDMWKQQYPMIRSQIIKDLQTNSSMRNAAKGATK